MAELDGAGSDLDRWLEPFLKVLGHKKRRTWAPMYLRGPLGPSERKSRNCSTPAWMGEVGGVVTKRLT